MHKSGLEFRNHENRAVDINHIQISIAGNTFLAINFTSNRFTANFLNSQTLKNPEFQESVLKMLNCGR